MWGLSTTAHFVHGIQGAGRRRSIWYESLKRKEIIGQVLALFELVILEIIHVTIKQRMLNDILNLVNALLSTVIILKAHQISVQPKKNSPVVKFWD